MFDPLKWLASFIPKDPSNEAGIGPFKLPSGHPFHRGAYIHDYRYDNPTEQRLSEADWELFNSWFYITRAETDPIKRCRLAKDLCMYWPLARITGRYLYNRKGK